MKDYTARFAVVYGLLAFTLLVAILALMWTVTAPRHPASKASLAALAAQVNPDDAKIVQLAEEFSAQNAAQNGVTLTKQRVVSVKHKASLVVVVLNVDSAEGVHYTLTVTMQKGAYSVIGFNVLQT